MNKRTPQEQRAIEEQARTFIRDNVDLNVAGLSHSTAMFFASRVVPPHAWELFFRWVMEFERAKRGGSLTPYADAADQMPGEWREFMLGEEWVQVEIAKEAATVGGGTNVVHA